VDRYPYSLLRLCQTDHCFNLRYCVFEGLELSEETYDDVFGSTQYYINLYSPKNSLVTTDRDRQTQKHTE